MADRLVGVAAICLVSIRHVAPAYLLRQSTSLRDVKLAYVRRHDAGLYSSVMGVIDPQT